jgi:signal transduction histidine kinase
MKLEHRLALLTAAVTAGTIATCLVTAFLLVQHAATRELDEEVIDGAKAAAVVVAQQAEGPDASFQRGIEIPDEVALIVQRIAVYSESGQLLARRPEGTDLPSHIDSILALPGAKEHKPFDLMLADGPMRATVVASRKLKGKTVLHAVSRAQLDEVIVSRARVFALLFLGTLALVILAARWLGRRLATDVNHVTAVARRVASGELTAKAQSAQLTSPETRNLARELDHMVSGLAALMESQRSFISYAAHELRSPLAAIQGELQLALRRPRTEEAYVETLNNALAEVVSLTQVAEDLLMLARAQADATTDDRSLVSGVVEDAIRMVQGVAQIQEVSFDVDIERVGSFMVVGRRNDLTRLLRNLFENAIKFGPRSGCVRVRGQKTDGSITIAIEDSGPGVAPKDQPNIFSPFYRASTKTVAQISGTGLGLAIAREIARKAGGDVTYDGECTTGARFLVALCIAQ